MALELLALRFSSGLESTLSSILELRGRPSGRSPADVDRRFLCFGLEDQWQAQKIARETRIPVGRYRIRLRKVGGFHERYKARFADMHVGMLELLDVPGFTDVLVHCGNTDDDTDGCLLLGDDVHENITARGYLAGSESAYRRVYPRVAMAAAQADVGAFITFEDFA